MLSISEHAFGVLACSAVIGPIWYGAVVWRRLLLPGWQGPLARLAEAVVGSATVLLLAKVLGAIGLFGAVPLMIAAAISSGVAVIIGRGREPWDGTSVQLPGAEEGRLIGALAGGVAVAVVSVYALEALSVLRGIGITDFDSLWYHLPIAADFVQDRSLLGLTDVANPPASFFAFDGELVHAIGMALLGHDALSAGVNLIWLAVALLSGWSIGLAFGRPRLALIGVATVAVTPLLVYTGAGTAKPDLMGLAFVLAAAAFIVNAGGARWPLLLAALSIGLIAATKLPMIPTAAALAVVAMLLVPPRGDRLQWAGWGLACILVVGSFWYVRNAFHAGNPVPWVGLQLGPLSLPPLGVDPVDCTLTPLVHWLGNPSVLRGTIVPELRYWLGLLWPALLVISTLGAALATALDRRPAVQMLGGVATFGWIAYLITPASGGEHDAGIGDPTCFGYNLRFALAPMSLGVLAALLAIPPKAILLASAGMSALFTVTMLSQDRPRWLVPMLLAAAAGLLALSRLRNGRLKAALPLRGPVVWGLLAVGLVVAVGAGLPVTNRYLDERYRTGSLGRMPIEEAARWARGVEDARIAVGGFTVTYPFYGLHGTNSVSYVIQPDSTELFARPRTCDEWRQALSKGQFDYVITTPFDAEEPPPDEAAWTRADHRATEILSTGPLSVFSFDARAESRPCRAGASGMSPG